MKEEIVAGVDLGGSKVTCLIAKVPWSEDFSDFGRGNLAPELIGEATAEDSSLSNGLIVDLEGMTSVIRRVTSEAEKKAGVKLNEIYVGVGGGHIKGEVARGVIPISKGEKEITSKVVMEVVEQAKAIKSIPGREIIYTVPQRFIIDEQSGIRNPVGMTGNRLEAEVYVVSGSTMGVQNIYKSLEGANLGVRGLVLQSIASYYAVLAPEDRDLGYVLIDIGEENTDVVIFSEGNVKEIFSLEVGGSYITNDIAMCLGIPKKEAENLKVKHGFARSEITPDMTFKLPRYGGEVSSCGEEEKIIDVKDLVAIIAPRVEEIFGLIKGRLRNIVGESDYRGGYLPMGVLITGGTAKMKGIEGLAERVFGVPARVGFPNTVIGLSDSLKDPAYASAVGLILYGMRLNGDRGTRQKMGKLEKDSWVKSTTSKVRKFLLE